MSSRHIRRAALLAAGLALAACASTSIVESWKAPGAGPLRFKKVLAVAILNNEEIRGHAEDALRGNLPGVEAVQGYKLFTTPELKDVEKVKERLRQEGFDGVIVLRAMSSEQHTGWTEVYVPLDMYVSYPPAELRVDTVVRVEIKIYSLGEDKLIWSGVSETFNPGAVQKAVTDIVAAAGKELRRQGLLKA